MQRIDAPRKMLPNDSTYSGSESSPSSVNKNFGKRNGPRKWNKAFAVLVVPSAKSFHLN